MKKTTDAEFPDWAKAHTPLPKDEGLAVFIDKLREEFRQRVRAYNTVERSTLRGEPARSRGLLREARILSENWPEKATFK